MQASIVAVLALLVAVAYAQETDVNSATCLLQRVDDPFGPGTGTVTFTLSGSLTFSWNIAGLANGNHFMGLYTYGDILSSNGTTLGPLFVDTSFFNVGNNPIVATNGVSTGTGSGTGYFLNGANDIIGRSIAVFGDGVDPNKLVMACVIGRADTKAQEDETQTTSDRFPVVRRATCQFRNTSFVTPAGYLAGWVDFEQATPNGPVTVEYFVHNVIRQDVVYHTSHIHWTGDISNDAAVATGPHYNNSYYVTSYGPRPGAVNELGSIGNPNVYNFTSDYKDTLTASFVDPIISLMGRNSIVGRSVVIHGWAASSATRIAQCVIGIKSDGEGAAPVPAISTMNGPQVANQYLTVNQTTRASALLKPTVAGTDKLTGMVQFETQPSGYVRVRYHIAGLSPGWHTWHVHEYGDLGTKADGLNTGAATGGHFIGIVSNRPAGTLQEVGALDNSKPIWADAYGYSRGEFIDTQIRLNGPNAIVGRSIIVHGNGTIAGIRVAQGVIGKRAETRVYDADIGPVGSSVQYAVAHVVYTSLGSTQLLGRVTFTQPSPNDDVSVHFDFAGLVPGAQHPWHVHQFGDLLGWDTVSSVAGHFIGINPVRPVGQKQEIGLLNDGIPLTADANGVSTGDFVDTQISLSGINSIVGRSIVVHVPVAAGGVARQAWGVIGVALYNSAVAAQPTWLLLVLVICAMLRMW